MENKSYAAFLSKKFGFTICSDFLGNTEVRISLGHPIAAGSTAGYLESKALKSRAKVF